MLEILEIFLKLPISEKEWLLEDLEEVDMKTAKDSEMNDYFKEKLKSYNEDQIETIKMKLYDFLIEELKCKSFEELYEITKGKL
mgnify:CR=1 FL=1